MGIRGEIPPPLENENPACYADRIGRWYSGWVLEQRKRALAQYLTPAELAKFMADLCSPASRGLLRVLDPGAGTGVLSCALCEAFAERRGKVREIELEASEIDPDLARCLVGCLSHAKEWLAQRGITLRYVVSMEDFVMAHADALCASPELFRPTRGEAETFDVAISNPPYFKIAKSDPRAQAAASVVHGQPNIYALFMAVSASLLRPGGQLVFVTPRSYAAGPYFRLFRERFFGFMRPEAIHLFGSRRDAFDRDEVLQESVILLARRIAQGTRQPQCSTVAISSSLGASDLHSRAKRVVPLPEVIDLTSKDKVLRIPVADEDDEVARVVRSWPDRLATHGLDISTGPVVPFRVVPVISGSGKVPVTHAPLLWMQNVTPMRVEWPVRGTSKPQYIAVNHASMPLLVTDRNYVLLRRFSAKEQPRRLTAAPLLAGTLGSPLVGIENHLNYIHRPGGALTVEEAYGLATLLNSPLLDKYFRACNGNTQVSATELRSMPLPSLRDISEIGRRAMSSRDPSNLAQELVDEVLRITGRRVEAHEVSRV